MVLVGYWPLNESSEDPDAPTAKDHSGNENHGTINDGADSTIPGATGVLGQNAYSFDGENDLVKVEGYKPSVENGLTSSVWFRTSDSGNRMHVVNQWGSGGSGYASWAIEKRPGDEIRFQTYDGNSSYLVESQPSYNDANWHHAALIFNKTKLKAYIDGAKIGEKSASIQDSTKYDLIVGMEAVVQNYWDGGISEFRLYDHALTSREIQYLYQVGKRGRQITSTKKS
jgi:hypothetical protein